MKSVLKYTACLVLAAVILVACDEDDDFSLNPSLHLEFSCDTLSFDTLFASVGSPTGIMRVYNRNSEALRIRSVELASGGASGFRVNVDGQYSDFIEWLEIRGGDSLYVFVEVTPREGGADVPLMLSDSLKFTLESGVQQHVTLLAYGRDVQFLNGLAVNGDTLLPQGHYVVYDSLFVGEDAVLDIMPGTTLYFHSKVGMRVRGTLRARGTQEQPICFRGDRTDNMFDYLPYDRIPGQWGGITFDSLSNNNILEYCDIHSADYGIRVEAGDTAVQRLTVEASRIENFNGNAIETMNGRVDVRNTLIANARGNCVKIVGGDVRFVHCTIANFYVWKQRDAALALHNSLDGVSMPLREASFVNCIITGSHEDEVMGYLEPFGDTIPDSANYRFLNSLVNTVADEENRNFVDVLYDNKEEHPFAKEHFRLIDNDVFKYDFHLSDSSSARGLVTGQYGDALRYDLDGVERPLSGADAGCFQYVDVTAEE